MDDGDRHPVACVDLAELHAARPAAQHHHAIGQLAQSRALAVGPVARFLEPRQGRDSRVEPTARITLPASSVRAAGGIADLDRQWIGTRELRFSADRLGALRRVRKLVSSG